MKSKKSGIYVCHTFYHVYIACLKELALKDYREKKGKAYHKATILLSTMSNDFGDLKDRLMDSGLFEDVIMFEEKREDFFPELAQYRVDRGSTWKNLLQRMKFTKRYAELEAPYVPVNFRDYELVQVFCDSDPIGYYLNQNRIHYLALEDGLNCLVHFDAARYDNRGHFGLKAFMSKRLNLIFVQNGYGKYCLGMEVNDIKAISMPCPYYVELPRKNLVDRLTARDKELLLQIFVKNLDALKQVVGQKQEDKKSILILTDPVCELDVREQIFKDIVAEYSKKGDIIIKPHPRDALDYRKVFPEYPIIDPSVPMEMLNFLEEGKFDMVVTVFTDLKGADFAEEKVRLGDTFMDQYEDPTKHNQNISIGITPIEPDDEMK